jgi:hypothetical protein
MSSRRQLYRLLNLSALFSPIIAAPSFNVRQNPPQCGFKMRTSVLANQNASKSKFNDLFLLAAIPGRGGTPDLLLDSIGVTFCWNQTQISEDQSEWGQGQNIDQSRLQLQDPGDKSSKWKRTALRMHPGAFPNSFSAGSSTLHF